MATRSMPTKYRPVDTTSSVSSNSNLENNNEKSSITIASPNNINTSEDDNAAKSSMNLSIQEPNSESLEDAQFMRRSDLSFWEFSNDPRLMQAAHFLCHPSTKIDSSSKKDLYLQMKGYSEGEINRAKIYAASAKDEKGNLDRIWGSQEEGTRSRCRNSFLSPAPRNAFDNWSRSDLSFWESLSFWEFSNDPRLMRAAHFLCHPSTKTDSSSKKDLYLQMKGYSEGEISRAKICAASAKDEKGNLDRIWGSEEEETRSRCSNSVSSPAPRNAFENWNCCSKFFTFIGILITYACGCMVGVFPAILAVNAMLRIFMRNEEWLKRWQSMKTSGIIMNGTVVSREHEINEITGFHTYSVTMNYDGSIVTDDKKVAPIPSSASTTNNTKCFDSLTDGSKEIYELTKFGTIVPLHVLHGHPNAAIPSVVLKRKISDIHFWTKYGDPFIAVWGMVVYFMCAELFLKSIYIPGFEVDEGFTIIFRAATIVGVLLMAPCLYAHTRFQFKEDQQKFLEEPASMEIQTDWFRILWHKLGPTGWKKACLFAFIPGFSLVLILGVVLGGPLALLGIWGMVYTLKFGPKWEVFLQDLKKDSIIAHGVVIKHSSIFSHQSKTMIHEVKARYSVAPPNGIGYYTVVTTTDSEPAYLRCSLHGNVDLYVNPETPRSGIIDSDFKDMMFQARLWNCFLAPLRSVFGLGTALGWAYLVYDDSFCIMLLALGFVLIAPQIYVLAENSFNKAKKSLLEKGEIEASVDIVPDVIPRDDDSAHLELAIIC